MSHPFLSRFGRWLCLLPFLLLGLIAADSALGQPEPKRTEELDTEKAPTRPLKAVPQVVGGDDAGPKEAPRSAPSADVNLAQAAKEAKNPAVANLFQRLAEPFDAVQLTTLRTFDAQPLPYYFGTNPQSFRDAPKVAIREIGKNNKLEPIREYYVSSLLKVVPYEQVAQAEVNRFLQSRLDGLAASSPRHLSQLEQLKVAEQALSAVVRFHESARDTGVRKGEAWAGVEAGLRQTLLDVLVKQLEMLVDAGELDAAFTLTDRLAATYPNLNEQQAIARPMTKLLDQALNKGVYNEDRMFAIRQRMRKLEEEFPNSEAIRPIRESLRNQADKLLDRANELAKDENNANKVNQARDLIRQAQELCPASPKLRTLSLKLGSAHRVLHVGVAALPRFLSPQRATTDIEKQCVELMFESLVKLSPDASGLPRYRPGLAEALPRVIMLGRRFYLPRNAFWSAGGDQPEPVTAADIRHSVALLKAGHATGRSPAWGDLLRDVNVSGNSYAVDVHLTQGFLDSLAPMTFKIVPNLAPDSKDFAENPVGSGPYRYERPRTEAGRTFIAFLKNPGYSTRHGATGRPRIGEIRFYLTTNPLQDFAAKKIDMALNLTSKQYSELRLQAMANNLAVPLPAIGSNNRRVYFLAVNHRHPFLKDVKARQALARAIDREKLLDDHFRAGLGRTAVHKALNSPYPAGSWACNPTIKSRDNPDSLDPFDPAMAKFMASELGASLKSTRLKLKYPKDNQDMPNLAEAMKSLCDQVRGTLGHDLLEPEPVDPWDLRTAVEETHDFDLAYYHYDFPDDTFWLMPLFGPRGPSGGENPFGWTGDLQLLRNMETKRAFGEVKQYAQEFHAQLCKEMPLIPLWQLDPFHAFTANVKTVPYDPYLVFTDADEWTLAH